MGDNLETYNGQLLDENVQFSTAEICRICHLSTHALIEYVEYGVVEPVDPFANNWHFYAATITRLFAASRLAKDLEINAPGIALILDLKEELEVLRRLNSSI